MKKHIKVMIGFLVALVVILLGFAQVRRSVDKYNNTRVEISIEAGKSTNRDIDITMEMSKCWDDYDSENNKLTGAQYDAVVLNYGNHNFKNWEIIVYMPKEARVDSLWNGEYVVDGDTIKLTPMDYNGVVEAGKDQPFGFVAISDGFMHFSKYKVYGYFEKTVQDVPLYWILWVTVGLWGVILVCYIVVQISIRGYKRRQKQQENIILQTMDAFVSFIDARDPYTHGHSERVAEYTKKIAEHMGLDDEKVRNYYYIALMHDCGKLTIPDRVLLKPGRLTEEERQVIERHTTVGSDILKGFTAIPEIQDGAAHHHERYDGTGYPDKLKGSKISLVARILCVADAFDAMNSDRCYRDRLPQETIIQELKDNAGKQFDPKIVEIMLKVIEAGEIEDWNNE